MLKQFFSILYFIIALLYFAHTQDAPTEPPDDANMAEEEKKLSDIIQDIIDHYKQPDPVGLPVLDMPDPFSIPDMDLSNSFTGIYLNNISMHGFSKFKIAYVNVEISSMQVQVVLTIDKLQSCGNYTISTWLNTAKGPFIVDVSGLNITAKADLGVNRHGKLNVQGIGIDFKLKTISINFEKLGFFGSIVQGLLNLLGDMFIDSFKSYVLKDVYTQAVTHINNLLDKVVGHIQFPNSISPLDMVIAELRKKIRNMNLDPYKIKNFNKFVVFLDIKLNDTRITGLSSLQRSGNITFKMENSTIIVEFNAQTQKLEGKTRWEISAVNDFISKRGTASFSIEFISAQLILEVPVDVRKRPDIRNVKLEMGNIQVRCDGAGTVDYIAEFIANILPNLIRYQVMDAIAMMLNNNLRHELRSVDEKTMKDLLLQMLELQNSGLNTSIKELSAIMGTNMKCEQYDEDEFFNF